VWLGAPDCYRNQDAVLLTPSESTSARSRSDDKLKRARSGRQYRDSRMSATADERGGTTPFNCLPIPVGGSAAVGHNHPAVTPYDLAAWWCRYILPENGVLLDPFCGSGTMLLAGLDHGASRVVGMDQVEKYLQTAKKRIAES